MQTTNAYTSCPPAGNVFDFLSSPSVLGPEVSNLRSGTLTIHRERSLLTFSGKAFLLEPKTLIQMKPFHPPSRFIRYIQKHLNPNLGSHRATLGKASTEVGWMGHCLLSTSPRDSIRAFGIRFSQIAAYRLLGTGFKANIQINDEPTSLH